jgi:TP901 family phage tail tape measure protein
MTGVGIASKLMVDDVNNAYLKFDESTTAVKALGSLSEEEFQRARDAALDLSTQVPISASEVTDAMYSMVSVGYDYGTMMETIPEATKLAVGGNQELKESIDTVINVMGAYGEGTYSAADITNILAKSVGVGKWELGDFTTEMQKNVGVAAQLGISFEDTAAANVLLQNKFTSAEEAGTAFKTMLLRLVDPKVQADLEELGIHVKDNEGNFVGLESVLDQLDTALQTSGGSVDKMSVLQQIFRTEGLRAAMALVDEKDKLGEMSAGMNDATFKNEAYNTVLESTSSQLEIANNKMEAAKIKLGEGMAPATLLAADAMSGFADLISGLPEPLQGVGGMALYAAQGFAALGPLLMGISALKGLGLLSTLTGIASGVKAIGVSGIAAVAGLGPLLPILIGLGLGLAVVYAMKELGFLDWVYDQGKACGKWLQDLGASWGQTARDVGAATADVLTHKGFLDWVKEEGANCGRWLSELSDSWATTASDIDKDAKIIEDAQGRLHVVTALELGGTAKTTKEKTEQVSKSIEEMKDNAGFDLSGFADYWNRFFGGGELEETGSYKVITLAGEMGEALGKLPGKAVKFGKEFVDSLSDTRKKTDKEIKGTSDSLDELDDPFSGVIDTLVDGTVRIADTVLPGLGSLGVAAVQAGIDIVGADLPGALGGAVAGAAAQVTGPADEIYRRIATVAGGAFLALKEQWGIDLPGAFGNVSEAFGAFGNSIQTAFTNLFVGIKDYIVNMAQGFISAGYNIIMYIVQGMQSAAGSVSSAIGDVLSTIWNFLPHSPALEGPLSKLPDFSSYFTQGLEASIPAVQAASMEVMANILPSAQPAAMGTGTSIGSQDNSASISIGNINASKDYTVSDMMTDLASSIAAKRKQKGYPSVVS